MDMCEARFVELRHSFSFKK